MVEACSSRLFDRKRFLQVVGLCNSPIFPGCAERGTDVQGGYREHRSIDCLLGLPSHVVGWVAVKQRNWLSGLFHSQSTGLPGRTPMQSYNPGPLTPDRCPISVRGVFWVILVPFFASCRSLPPSSDLGNLAFRRLQSLFLVIPRQGTIGSFRGS